MQHRSPRDRHPFVPRFPRSCSQASSLLRAGPPARHESVLDASQFLLLDALPLAPDPTPGIGHSIGPRLPAFRAEAMDQAHAASMPDTDWPISGHPPASSRDCIEPPVSMSLPTSRHFISGSLAFVFLIPTPDGSHAAFSSTLTTTVFSQCSSRWFDASPHRATPEVPALHLPHSVHSQRGQLLHVDSSQRARRNNAT